MSVLSPLCHPCSCLTSPASNGAQIKIHWNGKLNNNCNCNKYYCKGNVAGILGILLMNSETVDICRGDSYLWSVLLDYNNPLIYYGLLQECVYKDLTPPQGSLRASSPFSASEASLARTRERAAKRVLARLASLAQIGELARRLPQGSCPIPTNKQFGSFLFMKIRSKLPLC